MDFAHVLRQLRKRAGHEKARSFHSALIDHGVEINYAYYMKMEAGKVLPSNKVVEQISRSLADEDAATLILAYCRTLFPKSKHLFPSPDSGPVVKETKRETQAAGASSATGRELNRRQVHVLARSKAHYHLFLTATLARRPLTLTELQNVVHYKHLQVATADLEAAKIIRVAGDGIKTYANEHQFPSADRKSTRLNSSH